MTLGRDAPAGRERERERERDTQLLGPALRDKLKLTRPVPR